MHIKTASFFSEFLHFLCALFKLKSVAVVSVPPVTSRVEMGSRYPASTGSEKEVTIVMLRRRKKILKKNCKQAQYIRKNTSKEKTHIALGPWYPPLKGNYNAKIGWKLIVLVAYTTGK